MPPTVRDATEADLVHIVELLGQLAPDVPDREDAGEPLPYAYHLAFRKQRDAGHRLLVIEAGKKIVGTLVLYIIPNVSHQATPFAIIENVVVDEAARGKGYGEALIQHAVELARGAGCYKVSLTSNKRRTDAHRFYERLGFQRTHEAFRMDLAVRDKGRTG